MSIQKPSLPKGTRDFGPDKMIRRNYIFDTIKSTFKKFGFLPLETPAMENLSVLTGKYGDEGDQLIFKVLNSGDFLKDVTENNLKEGYKKLTPVLSEKALKYDLTVPFARFVVMNRNEIYFPFKRFQIQPVWRADRPQKGRYREFFQCDADVIGTDSLLCEAEIILMLNEVFGKLGLKDFVIKINNRKILTGITEIIGKAGCETDLCVAIDKLDKIGLDGVIAELKSKEFSEEAIQQLMPFINLKGNNEEVFNSLSSILKDSPIGLKGIEEIKNVFDFTYALGLTKSNTEVDVTLARGLTYYTGAIFEVKALGVQMGSISGGGRYDNLTGVFGLPNVSGVGISFGVDRIYDVLEELNLFPEGNLTSTKVLLCSFDEDSFKYGLKVLKELREANISSEIFPEPAKMKKQLEYANKKQIPYVIIIGSEEMKTGSLSFKNMMTGEQTNSPIDQIISKLIV